MKQFLLLLFTMLLMQIAHAQTQTEMNQTALKEYKAADANMALMYKKVMASMDSGSKKLLLEAQRTWIKFKEAHCRSAAHEYEGGSMQPLILYSCLKQETDARTAALKMYLEQEK